MRQGRTPRVLARAHGSLHPWFRAITRGVRGVRWVRRVPTVLGVALVLGSVPAASSAQDADAGFVGYQAAASGTALTAFPTVPALLPVAVPIEATLSLATSTLSSGGQGFGRASTFFPGTLAAGVRPLIETAAGVRLPLPDYPLVVEAREFEEAKRTEVPGVTMTTDVDPNRAVSIADVGAVGVAQVFGVRSLHTESRVVLEGSKITSTSTTTIHGLDITGVLSIGTIVSTAQVSSDGTTSTCSGGVTVSGASVAGTPVTIDDDGIHVQGGAGGALGLGRAVTQALTGAGLDAKVLGGDDGCTTAVGSRTTAGLLVGFPLPEFGSIPAGGGFHLVVGSTSATAGGSVVAAEDTGSTDIPPVFGDVVTHLPGPFAGDGGLPSLAPPTSNGGGSSLVPSDRTAYSYDGVPYGLLVGLLLLALAATGRVRRYMDHIIGLIGAP